MLWGCVLVMAVIMVLWLYSVIMFGMTMEFLVSITLLTAILLLVRLLFRGRVRAYVIHGLWMLIVLRLLLCVIFSFFSGNSSPEGAWSVNRVADNAMRAWVDVQERQESTEEKIAEEGEVQPVIFELGAIRLRLWVRGVWLLGSVVFMMLFAFLNERFRRKVYRTRTRLKLRYEEYPVYQVPQMFSPFVLRIRRERAIYLTEDIAEDEEKRKYVIAHEACHIEYHDLFWAAVRNMVLACFWFHPLVWMAAIYSKRDNEVACDERAVQKLGESERKNYGEVLLDMVDGTNRKEDIFYLATTMTAGRSEIYQRIRLLTETKKSQFISTVSAITVWLLLLVTCFTSYREVHGLNEVETIRQFLYYDSQGYRNGALQLYPGGHSGFLNWLDDDTIFTSYAGVKVQRICSIESVKADTMGDFTEWVPDADLYTELKWYRVNLIRRRKTWNEYKDNYVYEKFLTQELVLLGKVEPEADWQIVDWLDKDEREDEWFE